MDINDFNFDDPQVIEFLEKFGGYFMGSVPGKILCYETKAGDWQSTPETATGTYDLISQSIKQNKNLFLDRPKMEAIPADNLS